MVDPETPATTNPYAPPGASLPRPALPHAGELLQVDVTQKIPACCLKCASTEHIVRREQDFSVNAAGRGVGYAGGAAGAGIASLVRHDPSLLLPVVGVAGVALAGVAWVVHLTSKRVHLSLPLCVTCRDRWEKGVSIRRGVLAALLLGLVLALAGVATGSVPLGAIGGVAFVVAVAVAIAAKLPARFVGVQSVDGDMAVLTRVSFEAAAAIRQGLPKKARKKKAD